MIDANGTRHHLLLGEEDWGFGPPPTAGDNRSQPDASLDWDVNTSEVTLRPKIHRFLAGRGDHPVTVDQRRGASSDQFGNWYWVAADERSIYVGYSGSRASGVFWPQEPAPVATPAGAFQASPDRAPSQPARKLTTLTVSIHHYLIAGATRETQPGLVETSLLVFDLFGGGEPFEVPWPATVPLDLWDMAPAADGGAWLLDRNHQRYWRLDRHLQVRSRGEHAAAPGGAFLQSPSTVPTLGSDASARLGSPLSLADAFPAQASDPIAIESGPHDCVLVLDRGDRSVPEEDKCSEVILFAHPPVGSVRQQELARLSFLDIQAALEDSGPTAPKFPLTAHDLAFLPSQPRQPKSCGDVFIATSDGNQAVRVRIETDAAAIRLSPQRDFLPMRSFGGRALVRALGATYYDSGQRWVPLVAQRRPRFEAHGGLTTKVFDGRLPGCVWHRLTADACLQPGTSLRVFSRAADSVETLAHGPWLEEPQPSVPAASGRVAGLSYRRRDGSEIPFVGAAASRLGEGTWELLFQHARGRYLQLRLELAGDGVRSPSVHALRAWYPRFSYRDRYLPAVYRELDQTGFVERFLANFEGIFTSVEDRITSAQALFDLRSCPKEVLDWLASWFGVLLDPAWDEARRRLFLRHAMQFFQWRGTVRGLRWAVALATSECVDERLFGEQGEDEAGPFGIRIVEQFHARRYPLVVLQGNAAASLTLTSVLFGQRWRPSEGLGGLLARYGHFLRQFSGNAESEDSQAFDLPPTFPTRAPELAEAWQAFLELELGLYDLAQGVDETGWRSYLEHRYRTPAALRAAHESTVTSFAEVLYPDPLPAQVSVLDDWYRFESSVRPTRRTAHRFSVLVPVRSSALDVAEIRRKLQVAARVVALEKPAHTVFDVQAYWAMFRVGHARLGHDTLIDLGSAAPDLLPPFVVGHSYLARSYAGWAPAHDAHDRWVAGHAVIETRNSAEETSR